MTKPAIIKEVKTVVRFKGLGRTARAVGVSRGHLSYVMHGQRKAGRELAAKLRALGVELPEVNGE
jgi:DNA-binding phage protein